MTPTANQQALLQSLRERAERPPQSDPIPPAQAAALHPSYIDVSNSLAEDTIFANGITVQGGDQKVALFANPFANGREEMLYVDPDNNVRWVRHFNAESGGQGPGGLDGWSEAVVIEGAHQVVTAIHPDGSVWAFTIQDIEPGINRIFIYRLQQDAEVPGGLGWGKGYLVEDKPQFDDLVLLPVQYCSDRPATPAIFVDVPEEKVILCYLPTFLPDSAYGGAPWQYAGFGIVEPADQGSPRVVGIDSPDVAWQTPRVDVVRTWSVTGTQLFVTENFNRDKRSVRFMAGGFSGNQTLLSTWTHPHGAGAIATTGGPGGRVRFDMWVVVPGGGECEHWTTEETAVPLDDIVVWQDDDLLLHIFGRDPQGTMHVIHQTGWSRTGSDFPGMDAPTWERRPGGGLLSRPLATRLASFVPDVYPDEMANLFVQHEGVDEAEASGLFSQDLGSSVWCEEKIRFAPDTPPKPYIMPRYQTMLTVRNAYGNAVPGVDLKLTADATVDLEVGQKFYRTDPDHPVTLTTDLLGRVTLRVVATGLAVPQMHVTCSGLTQALSIQQASDVHAFFKGAGTLPNHPDGFTADTVKNATNTDGEPLFPNIKRNADSDADLPTAEDVVATVRNILSSTSTAVPPTLAPTWRLDTGEEVLGVSFQTHDPDRPAFEVFTSHKQMAARKEDLPSWDEITQWVGDAWASIKSGAAAVNEFFIDFVEASIVVTYELGGLVAYAANWVWNGIQGAIAAVEAFFSAIGAEVKQIVDWLKWLFRIDEALRCVKLLMSTTKSVPRLIESTLDTFEGLSHDFFVSKEQEVRDSFESMKSAVAGHTISAMRGPLGSVPSSSQPPAQVSGAVEAMNSPHVNWLMEKVAAAPTPTPRPRGEDDVLDDLVDKFFAILKDAPSSEDLGIVLDDVGDMFTELFSGKDAQSIWTSETLSVLDLGEHLIEYGLKWADDVTHRFMEWLRLVREYIDDWVGNSFEGSPLLRVVWSWVLEQAGMEPHDLPLSVGSFGAFLGAYPASIVWKLVTDEEMFPGDVVPFPPVGWEKGVGDQAQWNGGIATFQFFQGIVQTLDAILDAVIDLSALSINPETGEKSFKSPTAMETAFAWAHLFAYVIGDHPYFWGYPPSGAEPARAMPYVRYGFTFAFNVFDLGTVTGVGMMVRAFDPPKGEDPWQAFFASLCTSLAGWMRLGAQFYEFSLIPDVKGRDANWFEIWNYWINITAYIQTATGFIRYIYTKFPGSIPAGVALSAKMLVDVVGDIFSGASTMVQPMYELAHPPKIQVTRPPDGQPVELPEGTMWQPYEMDDYFQVLEGYPTYSWTTSSTGDFNDPDAALPPGLHLEVADVPGYGGALCRVIGWPDDWGGYRGTMLVQDNYGPAPTDGFPFVLIVDDQPQGVPYPVTFTADPTSGREPLVVNFQATTDGCSEWYWDFGDGLTSNAQNPQHTYATHGRYSVTFRTRNANGWGGPRPQRSL